MKKIYLIIVILLSVTTFSFAQRPQGGQRMTVEERSKKITEWMTTELSLKPEQVTPVDSINLLFTKAQQMLFQSAEGDREKIRETMSGLEKEKEAALSKVLTPNQLETYKRKIKEMMDRRQNKN